MARQTLFFLLLLGALAFLVGCGTEQVSPTAAPNIANPASVKCQQDGGKLDLSQDASGGAVGICKFQDGSECEEWAYFRGECKRGDKRSAPGPTLPARATPAAAIAPGADG